MKKLLAILVLFSVTGLVGCENASENKLRVQVIRGQINQVIRPQHGWVNTMGTVGDSYYDFSTLSHTEEIDIDASTADNAAVKLKISVTANPISDDASVMASVRKFGLEEEEHWKRVKAVLVGQVQTEGKTAVTAYDAYNLLKNQDAIQKKLFENLKPHFKDQLFLNLESVQIVGRPDFADDRIETAASQVIANTKLKEAAQAALDAAEVSAKQRQVEATTYSSSPSLLELEKLKLQKEIALAWAGHNGTLVFGNTSQLQIPTGGK